ncbi:putative benzoate 4-monooxygenase cytochrome P450 [Talaromyces proteolyticus]|uniref:Benzoate 4-monooxygenase cytochrome P450 n=1 Tax=Talaromyces proteolyticus TaxID=1131652 RepID=A0AAD4L2B3_9EURO|nr:putative benzoate 4-monooxygenase cytochrome P450 [Talaromyces proteolyticus]KAH8705884.1 putative benzoate 4-monooxygenase cytochrome P450 [Talaromyces proteolyticus]
MSFLGSQSLTTYSLVSGVALHLFALRHGEWDQSAPTIVAWYLVITALGAGTNLIQILVGTASISRLLGWHLLGLFGSIVIYRAFFHRLRKFPGPFVAGVTAFYASYLSAKKFHKFEEVGKLHRQYGDYVRLGPRELSVADPQAVPFIYGPTAKTTKGPFYDGTQPYVSLHTDRDKKQHARRRRTWDHAFSTKALLDYEPRVSKYSAQLLSVVSQQAGRAMNVARWFNYYSFDIMGDLTFGKSFEMLVTGNDSYMLSTLHGDMQSLGPFLHVMWIIPFFKRVPGLNRSYVAFWKWLYEQVDIRSKNEPERPDIFTWILKDFRSRDQTEKDKLFLHGDAELAVVAGSDTTAATLTNLFYELANSPEFTARLQSEIDTLIEPTYREMAQLTLLNAAIDETLRLHPALPSGMQRVTPPQGVRVGDVYIPGDCLVQIPLYTLFRDERCFHQPHAFIPERWSTRPELIKDGSAYIPFGSGPFGCAGKQLALMEIRRITVDLLSRYDIALSKEQTHEAFYEGQQDVFTLVHGRGLQLVFTERIKA